MRPSFVDVDLGAIRHNIALLRRAVAPARVCAVVKADGYGHGDVPVAEAALDAGAEWLAVALVEEGARLREAGIEAPVLLLSEPQPEDIGEVVRWGLIPTAYRAPFVAALAAAVKGPFPVQIKVDTGMHRVGADPAAAAAVAAEVAVSRSLRLQAVWTHLAVAEEDAEFTKIQLDRFSEFLGMLGEMGIEPEMAHVANSAGGLSYPEARFDMVRFGLAIYGLRPAPSIAPELDLRPAMSLSSRVSLVRRLPAGARPSYGRRRPLPADATVATVPLGYADGLSRRLGETGAVALINGSRYPFAGTVTMDQVVVDCGADSVAVGDEVVLLGRQGDEEISADDWARWLGTINYEVVCHFGPRLPRRYRS